MRRVIVPGGVGVTISSQSGWRMKQLTPEEDRALAMTPTEELLELEILQPKNITNTLHAYQLAKRCNEKRVMYEAVAWGKRGARLNDIAPGIIVTPLAAAEFNGLREVADVAELLMSERAQFITGATFLVGGGATASYYYGPMQRAWRLERKRESSNKKKRLRASQKVRKHRYIREEENKSRTAVW